MSELLPCPFCGEPNPCVWLGGTDHGDGTWRLYCEFCGVGFDGGKSREEIVGAWNSRRSPPAPAIDVEGVAKAVRERVASDMDENRLVCPPDSVFVAALRAALGGKEQR